MARCFISTLLTFLLFNSQPFFFFFSDAADSLAQGQSLSDAQQQTLVSAGDFFEFGFFSPGNSTTLRYVGIWYRNISPQSIVWVANRNTPIPASSAGSSLITLRPDGNLQLLDGAGNTIWSTNTSTISNTNSTARLTDSGNLVVVEAPDGTVSWQSFDHATDTFIPGMKMTLDRSRGKNQLLTSWKSSDDPSPGNYTLGLDPAGSAQIFIWEGPALRWRSGQWDGQTFIGTMMRPLYIYGFKLINDVSEGLMYFTFAPFNATMLRFVLEWQGVENTSMLIGLGSSEDQHWESVWVQPLNQCDFYGHCGDYGICAYYNGQATCSCFKGFDPKSVDEWSNGNWSRGCVRTTPLQCQLMGNATSSTSTSSGDTSDGFLDIDGVKLPDHAEWLSTVGTEADCRTACKSNCSCEAYAFAFGIGCLAWGRDLIDVYQFPQGGSVLYLKLAASELGTNNKTWKTIIIIISTVGVASLIICLYFWWKYNARMKNCWKKVGNQVSLNSTTQFSRDQVKPEFSGPSEGADEVQEGASSELPFYRFNQLATATNSFSDSNKLGQGGFGHVYKGILPGGQEIAVKRLSATSGQGLEEFKNEVILIAKLQHRNLVRLLGCCIEGEEKILVYEYMPNKSLDAFLFETTKQGLLDWRKRYDVIEGVARGLVYLHRDSRLRIVHRDLKASNILLDENMTPKISDFGMARIFGGDQNHANTNRVVGTYGYMSPEYAMEGLFSVKSDVYSFGVLVLEIIIGRRNNSFHRIKSSLNIVGYAWQFWTEDRATELIDESIRNTCSTHQVLRCIHTALLCVQDHDTDRPDMASVVLMLGSETAIFPTPKQPQFMIVGNPIKMEALVNDMEPVSVNDLTITVVEGR